MPQAPYEISVAIPARVEFVHVLRSVIASVAARLDWSYDEIDDLRLVVDEACGRLLATRSEAATLSLKVLVDDEGISIEASTDAPATRWPPIGPEYALTLQILSSLAEDVGFDTPEGRPVVRLRKRTVA